MELLFAHRKQRRLGNFSIESVFQTLTPVLAKSVAVSNWSAPYFSSRLLNRLLSILSLKRYIVTARPAIVHITGDTHFLIWGTATAKSVLTIHDIGFLHINRGLRYAMLKYFWLTGPIKRASAVTCVSEATRKEIIAELGKDYPIRVIPSVIDPRFLRQEKMFNTDKPVILLLGSAPNKNLKRVLTATRNLNVHLCLIARLDAEELRLLDSQSYEAHQSLTFDELLKKYHLADIVSLCSTHEGFGMPIIEAQTIGRVVLTSNYSSMPEVAGDGALFVDPFSVQSIREGFERLINDEQLRQQLIVAGFENVKRFDTQKVADQYLQLYRELVA
jgi:glycosyltransferase involved in cell wall biosynthesis